MKNEHPTGYVLKATLIKDEGCIDDVIRAAQASGVAQRKQTEDLVRYGCISDTDPDNFLKQGWIFEDDFLAVTKEQFLKMIEDHRQRRENVELPSR